MVAGAKEHINTLFTIEAQRVISIYHEFRKKAKQAQATPQVVVQEKGPDALEQLKKLSTLKDAGIISEEEFEEKKKVLLAQI